MRIIGGNDYYDSALAYGRDDDVVFVRQKDKVLPSIVETNRWGAQTASNTQHPLLRNPVKLVLSNKNGRIGCSAGYKSMADAEVKARISEYHATGITVWLCGKRYQGVQWSTFSVANETWRSSYIWNLDELERSVSSLGFEIPRDVQKKWSRWSSPDDRLSPHEWLEKYFSHNDQGFADKKIQTWMIENRITHVISAIDNLKHVWKVDSDGLKDVQFYKVVDPYTAFQEIAMWVGGTLPRNPNTMVEITDDKIKAHKHGFDKWSFRKMPQK
jgi:hypothetical protein